MAGRTLGGATMATIQGIIIFLLTLIIGFRPYNVFLLPIAFLIMFLIALFFTALGTAIASLMEDFHGFQLIMNFLVMPLFFLSGALFPLNGLPLIIQMIANINPLSYGVDGLRASLVNVTHFGLTTNIIILTLLSLVTVAIGSLLFFRIEA